MSDSPRLLSILACAVGFSALTGCAPSSFRDVPAPPQVAEMRGRGDEELVFTAGRQTPSSTVRISSR